MKKYKIYRLVDPTISPNDPKYVRYIGWTNKTLSSRLSNHITEAKHDETLQHTHKNRWINKLLAKNTKPEIQLVDSTDDPDEIKNMEIYYIAKYKEGGAILTNATLGGDGQLGRVVSDEQKALFEKAVDVYTKSGEFVETIKSLAECAKKYLSDTGKISMVCNGKRKSAKNMVFRFHGDSFDKYSTVSERGKHSPYKIKVILITEDGKSIKEYESIGECARQEGIVLNTLKSYLNESEFTLNGKRRVCKGKYFKKILSNLL